MKDQNIVFVGGGIANTKALATLVDKLEAQHLSGAAAKHVHLRLYDVRSDFIGGGAGWSMHAFHPGLMINTRIFPQGEFYEWLVTNKDRWMQMLNTLDTDDALGIRTHSDKSKWRRKYTEALGRNDFREMPIPRIVLGFFLQEKLFNAIEKAKRLGIDVELVEGEIDRLEATKDGFEVDCHKDCRRITIQKQEKHGIVYGYKLEKSGPMRERTINASDVVLGIGRARPKTFEKVANHSAYLDALRLTEKSNLLLLGQKISAAYDCLNPDPSAPPKKVRVACVGYSSSFFDICHLLDAYPEMKQKLDISVLTSNGRLMPAYATVPKDYQYRPLFDIQQFAADDPRLRSGASLIALLEQEMQHAFQGQPEFDLSLAEKHFFFDFLSEGIRSGKIAEAVAKECLDLSTRTRIHGLDRAAQQTLELINSLQKEGVVRMVPLSCRDVVSHSNKLVLELEDPITKQTSRKDYDFVVNCTGYVPLKDIQTPFLRKAIDKGLITVNGSHNGFAVNQDRQIMNGQQKAQNGLFAVGDVVIGNYFPQDNLFRKTSDKPSTSADHYRRISGMFEALTDGNIVGSKLAEQVRERAAPATAPTQTIAGCKHAGQTCTSASWARTTMNES